MKRNFDLVITNCITNEVRIAHDFSDFCYADDKSTAMSVLLFYTKYFLDNQIPFKTEFNYK